MDLVHGGSSIEATEPAIATLAMISGPGSPSTLALQATALRAAVGLTGISGPGAWGSSWRRQTAVRPCSV